MKRLVTGVALALASIGATLAVAVPANASPAVETNLGWCQSGLPSWQHPFLAPANGNGPLVIVNGDFKSTNGNAFNGYMGCYK